MFFHTFSDFGRGVDVEQVSDRDQEVEIAEPLEGRLVFPLVQGLLDVVLAQRAAVPLGELAVLEDHHGLFGHPAPQTDDEPLGLELFSGLVLTHQCGQELAFLRLSFHKSSPVLRIPENIVTLQCLSLVADHVSFRHRVPVISGFKHHSDKLRDPVPGRVQRIKLFLVLGSFPNFKRAQKGVVVYRSKNPADLFQAELDRNHVGVERERVVHELKAVHVASLQGLVNGLHHGPDAVRVVGVLRVVAVQEASPLFHRVRGLPVLDEVRGLLHVHELHVVNVPVGLPAEHRSRRHAAVADPSRPGRVLAAGLLLVTHLSGGQAVGAARLVAVLALGHSLRHVVVETFVLDAFHKLVLQAVHALGLGAVTAEPGHVFWFL